MGKIISFHFSKTFIYIILVSISRVLIDLIKQIYPKEFQSILFYLLLMHIGETFAVFLFEYEIRELKIKSNEFIRFKEDRFLMTSQKDKINRKKIIWTFFILFICTFNDILGSIPYINFFYNFEMKKFEGKNDENIKFMFLFIFYFINEKYYLNINRENHHNLGIILNIISFILMIIIFLFNNSLNEKKKIFSLILIIIIQAESQFLQTINHILSKKLNYEYFMNMNLILFIEGVIGVVFVIIADIIYNIYHDGINFCFMNFIINDKKDIIKVILFLIFCFLMLVLNVLLFKIIEVSRPSHNIMGKALSNLFINISHSIYNYNDWNKIKEIWSIDIILISIFSVLGTFIYCETITLNFCNLDKYTKEKTAARSDLEIYKINLISSDSSTDEYEFIYN